MCVCVCVCEFLSVCASFDLPPPAGLCAVRFIGVGSQEQNKFNVSSNRRVYTDNTERGKLVISHTWLSKQRIKVTAVQY